MQPLPHAPATRRDARADSCSEHHRSPRTDQWQDPGDRCGEDSRSDPHENRDAWSVYRSHEGEAALNEITTPDVAGHGGRRGCDERDEF